MDLLRERLKAWLQLVRLPNLLTVPGDPLAGMLLAADTDLGAVPAARAAAVAVASLFLYAAGLIWNDVADIEEDRRERPARPLPRGAITVRSAAVAGVLLTIAGVALAALAGSRAGTVAVLLAAAVITYDTRAKRSVWLGPLTMALCRALSLLMGAALAVDTVGTPRGLPLAAASGLFVYVTLLSIVAREETHAGGNGVAATGPAAAGGWARWLPAAGMACGFISVVALLAGYCPGTDRFTLAVGGIAAIGALAVCAAASAEMTPERMPRAVGMWVLCLIPMQAAWCLWSGQSAGLWAGGILLAAWPAALIASKRFYAS